MQHKVMHGVLLVFLLYRKWNKEPGHFWTPSVLWCMGWLHRSFLIAEKTICFLFSAILDLIKGLIVQSESWKTHCDIFSNWHDSSWHHLHLSALTLYSLCRRDVFIINKNEPRSLLLRKTWNKELSLLHFLLMIIVTTKQAEWTGNSLIMGMVNTEKGHLSKLTNLATWRC